MDAGSSQTTTMTSCAALVKAMTLSAMPAAVSISSTSMRCLSSLKARIKPACSTGVRFAIRWIPDDAGMILMPPGPSSTISSSVRAPLMPSAKVYEDRSPSSTSTLARPKSASSNVTLFPDCASAIARFTEVLVLPSPPLPHVTAMTLTGRGRTLCRRPSAWSGLNLVSIAWRPPVRRQDHLVFVHRTSLPHERESLADQFVGAGKMQILRHTQSVAHVHERQAGLDHGEQHFVLFAC